MNAAEKLLRHLDRWGDDRYCAMRRRSLMLADFVFMVILPMVAAITTASVVFIVGMVALGGVR